MKRIFVAVVVLFAVISVGMSKAEASVSFTDLGTSAPPASIGGRTVTAFDAAAQAAILNGTSVSTIPGSPFGSLTVSPNVTKQTIGSGWATWSHGYTGSVYTNLSSGSITLTLPANTGAFYFYAEPNSFSVMTITATTNSGATSGPINVNGSSGANGFGFVASAGDTIATITVSSSDASGFAVGEFGIGSEIPSTVPTMNEWGLVIFMLLGGLGSLYFLRKKARV